MTYFLAENYNEGIEGLFEHTSELKKGDYVVVADYNDEPVVAKVVKLVSRYQALTSTSGVSPIIDIVRINEWKAKREKELENSILLSKMEDKVKEITLMNKLEKFAGQDPEMTELLKQFKKEVSVSDEEVE